MSMLSTEQALAVITEAIRHVAPELADELPTVDPALDVWEYFELDSMDHMNVMVELFERTGVEVPEREYGQLRSLSSLAEYLVAATA